MPKKHTPGFKTAKPKAAPHSSLTSRSGAVGESHTRVKSVNELLQELRVSQGASGPSISSPEPGNNQHQQLQARRNHGRVAGPPPPRSWISPQSAARTRRRQGLEASRHAYPKTQGESGSDAIPIFFPPPLLPDQPLPQAKSLRSTALRLLAQNLSWYITNQQEWLDDVLTTRMKCELIGVIALQPFSASSRLSKRNMRYLFGPQRDSHGRWLSGGEGVTHLSFSSEIRRQSDYLNLASYLKQESHDTDNTVPESWDETDASGETSGQHWSDSSISASDSELETEGQLFSLPLTPSLPLLPSLTHLSLARPHSPCWNSLIEIGSLDALCHLTHLDLSYWPAPTLNSSAHDVKLSLLQGASTINRVNDTEKKLEIIRVFNQLGKACRKLVWLGLEGCETWILSLLGVYSHGAGIPRLRWDIASISTTTGLTKVDWTGVWRGLETLKVAQSWVPRAFIDQERINNHPELEPNLVPVSTFVEWWVTEERLLVMERVIANRRLELKQSALKLEKTPIQSWIELEVRSVNYIEAVRRWMGNPMMQDGIDWTIEEW